MYLCFVTEKRIRYNNDGFRDANFIFEEVGLIGEKLGIDIGVWKADGLGPNLELPGGTPFNYAPSFIILPYF